MTAEAKLKDKLTEAVAALGVEDVDIQLDRPRNPEHGDWATNLAMVLASRLGKPPRAVAELILEHLDVSGAGVSSTEVAGPGFINFRLSDAQLQTLLEAVLLENDRYGRAGKPEPRRVVVEFVSANPTGPLHVAHGRGAALGDAIATLLAWAGDAPHREFYVNDAGVQIDRLAESVDARWRQLQGEDVDVPEGGYQGEYVKELAQQADAELAAELAEADDVKRQDLFREWAVARLEVNQAEDLKAFGIVFDEWYRESRVYREGRIQQTLADLDERGLTYEKDGALWLRTTGFGDDKDRVLRKRDGNFT